MAARAARAWRIAWTVVSFLVVESIVFSAALLPATLTVLWLNETVTGLLPRVFILSLVLLPAYLSFALALLVFSALATRLVGWRTPPDTEMSIAELDWPLLGWARYVAATHLVRLVAGNVFRATPLWTFYVRLNGARAGRRVYLNSLAVTDHNLLEFGEGTVVGAGVRLSGHTVEDGVVRTARTRSGRNVTLGAGSIIGIGVEIGEGTKVGALSLVPKNARLAPHAVYYGIPVQRVDEAPRQARA